MDHITFISNYMDYLETYIYIMDMLILKFTVWFENTYLVS